MKELYYTLTELFESADVREREYLTTINMRLRTLYSAAQSKIVISINTMMTDIKCLFFV